MILLEGRLWRLFARTTSLTRSFSVVHPHRVSPQIRPENIPGHVVPPSYYRSGDPGPGSSSIDIKSPEEQELARQACRLARHILRQCEKVIAPGVTTDEIDQLVTQLSFQAGAYPSPLNYRNFPKSVCTSVNNCVCHGIPDLRQLLLGDIINVDVTVFSQGFHGDCSATFKVGEVDAAGEKLIAVTQDCLNIGIQQCGPNKPFRGIGSAIESFARKAGLRVVPAFTGHGIGRYFHGPPDIYHCRNKYPGVMKPGMIFTIEPALSEGSPNIKILHDNWTAVTTDNSRSAQFEHTVLITESGVEVLTA